MITLIPSPKMPANTKVKPSEPEGFDVSQLLGGQLSQEQGLP